GGRQKSPRIRLNARVKNVRRFIDGMEDLLFKSWLTELQVQFYSMVKAEQSGNRKDYATTRWDYYFRPDPAPTRRGRHDDARRFRRRDHQDRRAGRRRPGAPFARGHQAARRVFPRHQSQQAQHYDQPETRRRAQDFFEARRKGRRRRRRLSPRRDG